MKKPVFLIVALTLIASLTACGGSGAGSADSTGSNADDRVYTIRFATSYGKDTLLYQDIEWWADQLEERSEGRLRTEIYDSASLMPVDQQFSALLDGRIEADMSNISTLVAVEPLWSVFQLPGVLHDGSMFDPEAGNFRFLDNTVAFMQDPVFTETIYSAMENKGFKSWPALIEAPRHVATVKKPIRALNDLKGLKIRITGGKWNEAACAAFGFSPVALPSTELSTALMQGTIDGAMLVPVYSYQMKSPVKYWTTIPFDCAPLVTIDMSLSFLNSLPEDLRRIIEDVGEDLFEYSIGSLKPELEKSMDELRAQGIEIINVDAAELEKARQICVPVWKQFAQEVSGGQAFVDKALEIAYGKKLDEF